MPVVPSCLLEPIWVEFCALLGRERPGFDPSHPLGCHRRRVPDRVVFEHVVAALVHGSGYERIATPGCSDRTIRRRLKAWAALGIGEQVHALALAAYDQAIHLDPSYAVAYYSKGNLLMLLERLKEAQLAYEAARRLGYKGNLPLLLRVRSYLHR